MKGIAPFGFCLCFFLLTVFLLFYPCFRLCIFIEYCGCTWDVVFSSFFYCQDLSKPNLSSREIDEIIEEWKPEPLVPPLTEEEIADAESMPVGSRFPYDISVAR